MRSLDKSRRSRSFSPVRRDRYTDRLKLEEEDFRRLSAGAAATIPRVVEQTGPSPTTCVAPVRQSRRSDGIIELTGGNSQDEVATVLGQGPPPVNQDMSEAPAAVPPRYRYATENDPDAEYNTYYQGRNLTYPRINDASTDSPKRLSLDDRCVFAGFKIVWSWIR